NTDIHEFPERRVGRGPDREYLVPDGIRFKGAAEVVRELLADHVPVRLGNWLVLLVVKPDRAGMHPHQFRDRHMAALIRQNDSSTGSRETGHIYLWECSGTVPHRAGDQLFIPAGRTDQYGRTGNLGQYPPDARPRLQQHDPDGV